MLFSIVSVIQPITFDTMLNNNGPGFKNVTCKQGLIKYDNEAKQKSHLAHARVHTHTHKHTTSNRKKKMPRAEG